MPQHGGNIYQGNGRWLDFSANINPMGMPETVCTAIAAAMDDLVHYPDPRQKKLRQTIAAYHKLPMAQIVCGNGGADVISAAACARARSYIYRIRSCTAGSGMPYHTVANAFSLWSQCRVAAGTETWGL